MFEDSLAVSTVATRPQSRWIVAASFALQACIVLALILVPLLHPAALKLRSYDIVLARPVPPLPPRTRPAPHPVHLAATPITEISMVIPAQPMFAEHPAHPHLPAEPSEPVPAVGGRIVMGAPAADSPFPGGLGEPSGTSHVAVIGPGQGTGEGSAGSGPHAVSTGVSQGLLLAPIRPIYPSIAIAAHQQGVVTVEAVISTAGHVESAHATAGPAMLQGAAVEAVRNARYKPFYLNGQPTEVAASFSIRFNLNQ